MPPHPGPLDQLAHGVCVNLERTLFWKRAQKVFLSTCKVIEMKLFRC